MCVINPSVASTFALELQQAVRVFSFQGLLTVATRSAVVEDLRHSVLSFNSADKAR